MQSLNEPSWTHVWYVHRMCTLPKTEKLFEKASKRVFGTPSKTCKWPPNCLPDTLGKQSCARTPLRSSKRTLFSCRSPHGGGHRHSKMVSKSFQNNPKIKTPWQRPTGISFLCDLEPLTRRLEQEFYLLFEGVSHAYVESGASSTFQGCLLSVHLIWEQK